MTGTLPVLMYHHFPTEPDLALTDQQVPLTEFRMHLRTLLADGWELLGLTEALAAVDAEPTRRVVGITVDDGYADFAAAAMLLAELGAKATLYVPTDTVGTDGYLDWDDLGALGAFGIEIGSHSCRHLPMDTLRRDALDDEVMVSRTKLTSKLGVDVRSFSYPHGYHSRRVRRTVASAGYTNACSVGRRIASPAGDRFAVPRLQPVSGMSPADVRRLVDAGEPGLAPVAKRALQPAWRLTRLAGLRVLGHDLT